MTTAPVTAEPIGPLDHPDAPTDLKTNYMVNPLGIDDPRPRFFWEVNDKRRGAVQGAYQVVVAISESQLSLDRGDVWDSGRQPLDQSVQVEFNGLNKLRSRTRYHWKVRTWDAQGQPSPFSKPAWFEMGVLEHAEWTARWIGSGQVADGKAPYQSPYLRKVFRPSRPIVSARLYVSAAGLYEVYLNGARLGKEVFQPGWTDYTKRIQYQTYDVTALIKQGENALGAILGEGWYSGNLGWHGQRNHYGKTPSLFAQLVLRFADSRTETVNTDTSWKWAPSPVLESDIYRGESYDARLEQPGWCEAVFADAKWQPAVLQETPSVKLVGLVSPPVRAVKEVKPINITEPVKQGGVDTYIFDLGQNITGVPKLMIQGPAGATIQLRHAEVLNADGTLYTDNLRSAKQVDHYTLKGKGVEVYQPRFTFHGFRYVELTGLPPDVSLNLDTVTGVVLHSDTAEAGTFECNDPLVNQLHQNIVWGQRGNFLDVPTDCPQRDERLGWMGDAQIFARTATHNMDVAGFFNKWMVDVEIAQRPSGAFPFIVPDILAREPRSEHFYGAAGWSDAGVIVPWVMYQVYGDKRILMKHYEAMSRWMGFLEITSDDLIRKPYGYGDWLDVNDPTNKSLIGTAFFALDAKLMVLIAQAAGMKKDIKRWQTLEKNVVAAFNREFVTPGGRIVGNSQTAYALAISFDLLPDKVRLLAGKHLAQHIAARGNHLATGFLGTSHLMHALTKSGNHDLACKLLLNETYPSWGYSIKNGATTIWERWDGWTKEKGFQNPGMNSFNHYAFGAVGQWMYMHIGGIDLDSAKAGFKHVIIAPKPTERLTSAKASYASVHGKIEVAWQVKEEAFELSCSIAPNTTATVRLPGVALENASENGLNLTHHPDVKNPRMEGDDAVLEVGSGQYRFEGKLKPRPLQAEA